MGLFDSYWILLTLEIVRNGVGLISTQPILQATVVCVCARDTCVRDACVCVSLFLIMCLYLFVSFCFLGCLLFCWFVFVGLLVFVCQFLFVLSVYF